MNHNYWLVAGNNSVYNRRKFGVAYLVLTARNKNKTQLFLYKIADFIGVKYKDLDADNIYLLDNMVIDKVAHLGGGGKWLNVPSESVVIKKLG